jgi:hypothetical protein
LPAACGQDVAVVENPEPPLVDRVGELLDAFVERPERVTHGGWDAQPIDEVDHRRSPDGHGELRELRPAAQDDGIGRIGEPAGGSEVVGMAVRDHDLRDVGQRSALSAERAIEELTAVGPQHPWIDHSHGVIDQHVAVDRADRKRSRERDVDDPVGQVLDDRSQGSRAQRWALPLPGLGTARPDQ